MVQRTTAHFPHPPQCTLLIKDKVFTKKRFVPEDIQRGSQVYYLLGVSDINKANSLALKSEDRLLIVVPHTERETSSERT